MKNYLSSLKLLLKRLLLLVIIYQLSRIAFYFFNKSYFEFISIKEFIAGFRFDFSAIIYTNLIIILGHTILGNFKYHKTYQIILKYLFFIINIVFIATNFIDIEYFKFTSRRSSYSLITAQGMEHEMKKLFLIFLKDFWYLSLGFLILVFLFFKSIPSYSFKDIKKEPLPVYLKQGLIFIVVIGVSLLIARGGFQKKVLSRVDAVKYTDIRNTPLVLNTPFCILKTFNKNEILKNYNYFNTKTLESIYNPIKKPHDSLALNNKNIIYIILESFGNEHVGFMNNGKGFTPFLDSLIKKSTFYKNGFANGKLSIDAVPSVVSSLPRLMEKAFIQSSYSFNETRSLPKLLKDIGYQTSFFHGAFNGSQNFDDYAKIVGYDQYFGENEYPYEGSYDGYWGIYDEEFLHFFGEKLTTFKEPFFSTIFTLSSHNPYSIPEKYKDKFPKGTKKVTESVGYTDFALKQFFSYVKDLPWYNNTIFVLVADHTSSEGDRWYNTSIGKFSIPILFFEPGNKEGNKISDKIFQQIDIMPTILNKINYPKPYFSFGNEIDNDNRFAISYLNSIYHFVTKKYFILYDGKEVIGVYKWQNDKMLKNDLSKTANYSEELKLLKAVIQTYNQSMNENKLIVRN